MSTLTIRLPADTHRRLTEIARQRGMRFRVVAARGPVEEGLRVLDTLDAAFAGSTDSERGQRQ